MANVRRSRHRNIQVTAEGLRMLAEYAKRTPWYNGPYRPAKRMEPRQSTQVWFRNPACKHAYTSYDVMTCAECKAYSIERAKQWAAEKQSQSRKTTTPATVRRTQTRTKTIGRTKRRT